MNKEIIVRGREGRGGKREERPAWMGGWVVLRTNERTTINLI